MFFVQACNKFGFFEYSFYNKGLLKFLRLIKLDGGKYERNC